MSSNRAPTILIADDDLDICKLVKLSIKSICGEIKIANTGKHTLEYIELFKPDIIILDITFPDLDGFSICSWIRKNETLIQPIIIVLSARSSDKDKIFGYDIGADEYISKPFSPMFMSRRIQMLWKQKNYQNGSSEDYEGTNNLQFKEIIMNIEQKRVFINTKEINLTFMEWQLLLLFMQNPGKVFSRNDLINVVKGEHYIVYERTIDVHLFSLRKKLGVLKSYICTKRGMGYYLDNSA